MKLESVLCVSAVVIILLLVLQFSRDSKEPFVDLNIDLKLSNEMVDTGLNICNTIVPVKKFITDLNYNRCLNPRVPDELINNGVCMPVHQTSRSVDGGFYQRGILIGSNQRLPLYQRKNPKNFKKNYYYTTDDHLQPLKYNVEFEGNQCSLNEVGCDELQNGDVVSVPSLNAQYKVSMCERQWDYENKPLNKISETCKPKYFPNRYYTHNPPIIMGLDW
tara:strand:- start:38 stop:694 length:657 start_codon:yes stop_codon:yes gene_type:complete